MKKSLLITLLLIVANCVKVMAWTPSLTYAGWVGDVKMDRAWENITQPIPWESTTLSWGARYNYVNMVPAYNCLAWSIMIWDERRSNSDDYNLQSCTFYLYNKQTNTKHEIVYLQFDVSDDNDTKFDWMSDKNGNDTRIAGIRFFDKDDGSQHMFLTTILSDQTRQFILDAGQYNLQIGFSCHWDDKHWNDFDWRSDVSTRWVEDFTSNILTLGDPSLSNVQWTKHGNNSAIAYDVNDLQGNTEISLQDDRYYANNRSYTSAATNQMYDLDEVTRDHLERGNYVIKTSAWQRYTVGGYPYQPYSMDAYNTSSSSRGIMRSTGPDYRLPRMQQPQSITATQKNGKELEIKWSAASRIAGEAYDESDWVIERSKNRDFTGSVKLMRENYYANNTDYSRKDTIDEENEGLVTYYYRIYREHMAPFSREKDASYYAQCTVNTDYPEVSGLTATSSHTEVTLNWNLTDGLWNNQTRVELSYGTTTLQLGKDDRSYTVSIPTCTPTTFVITVMDGVIERSRATITDFVLSSEVGSGFASVSIGKGFSSTQVPIRWTIKRDSANFNKYEILRKEFGAADYESVKTIDHSPGIYQYSYIDEDIVAGTYYTYHIDGYTVCDSVTEVAAQYEDIGFAQPYGVVSGQITYEGNQGVSNVCVIAQGEGKRQNCSLRLTNALASAETALNGQVTNAEGTVEMWMRPDTVLTTYPMVRLAGLTLSIDSADLKARQFNHVAWTWHNGSIATYVNGRFLRTQPLVLGDSVPTLKIGGTGFVGWIDEIRTWKTYRDSAQIRNNFDCYLSGSEVGLTSYYRCDDKVENWIYDISRVSSRFNEHHAATNGCKIDDYYIPTQEQLALKTYTDANGNYLLNSVPYTEEGCLYTIVPSLGVHEFAPSNRPLFFDRNTSTHNSINFTDVSSFEVSGRVTYANTDYPVEGCQFMVDGTICVRNEKAVESGKDGTFIINVPIGKHYITIRKDGHTFTNGGRFPADPDSIGKRENFNQPRMINFTDETTVLLVGRVAGGEEEKAKPHGMNMGKANIGAATITLEGKLPYDLNLSETTDRLFDIPDSVVCASRTYVLPATENRAKSVIIKTDSVTGEFVAKLPPIDMVVKSISLDHNPDVRFNTAIYGDITLGSSSIHDTQIDSIRLNDTLHQFEYFKKLDVIHRVNPRMDISELSNRDGAFGEETYSYRELTGAETVIPLYTKDTTTGVFTYHYNYPIYTQGNTYTWHLHAYEPYVNYDKAVPDTTRVPLSMGNVTFLNSLGLGTHVDTADTTVKELGTTYQLSESGEIIYRFVAADPTVSAPYTKSFTITYTDSAKQGLYNGFDQPFEGIIFGAKTSGTNFVTLGSDKPMFVLRDPPGAQSYATWKKGTSFTYTETHESTAHTGATTDLVHIANSSMETVSGFGIGIITENFKSNNEGGVEAKYKHEWLNKNQTSYSVTTDRDISTSSGLRYTGAMGDVYIGVSTNTLYGNARHVKLERDTTSAYGWKVDVVDALAYGEEFSTSFNYTQRYIIEDLIPKFRRLRNAIIHYIPAGQDTITVNPYNYPLHISHLSPDDPRYGTSNSDSTVWGNAAVSPDSLSGPSYRTLPPAQVEKGKMVVDTVDFYNHQIKLWENTIAYNEHMKVLVRSKTGRFDEARWNAAAESVQVKTMLKRLFNDTTITEPINVWDEYKDGYLIDNLSFDGGGQITDTYTSSNNTVNMSGHSNTWQTYVHAKVGICLFGIGGWLNGSVGGGNSSSNTTTKDSTKMETISYTLAANDYEALTVDVFHAPDNAGPIFATRGGQTYCPYEDEEVARYYEPDRHHVLSTATVKMEDPVISAQQTTRINVPVGKPAVFTVKLANEADMENSAAWLFLYQVEASNKYGAIVSMDGSVISGSGRTVYVNTNNPIQKTITITQTRPDILDYDSIAIVLASNCSPYVEADTLYLSAHFIPTCSDVNLVIDQPILNIANTDTTLHVLINNYDTTFSSLRGIRLEYRMEGQNEWHKAHEWVKNPNATLEEGQSYLPAALIHYTLPMTSFADGTYYFRAVTSCFYSADETPVQSDELTVIKDYTRPEALGLPSPINGIYTVDNEIFVTMNEEIQTGSVTPSCVEVTGVLNAHKIDHAISFHMQPDTELPAYTEASYDLNQKDFAIEMWTRLYPGEGTLVSHNEGGLEISVWDGKLQIYLHQQGELDMMASEDTIPLNEWIYLAVMVQFNQDSTGIVVDAYASYGETDLHLIHEERSYLYSQRGRMQLGRSLISMPADIHDLQVWTCKCTWADIKSSMHETKELYVGDLYGYWPMDEGKGNILHEKMRNRHMTSLVPMWVYRDENHALSLPQGQTAQLYIGDKQETGTNDMALEFWFRASDSTMLFSETSGMKLNVGIYGYTLYLSSIYGETRYPLFQNFTDGVWHHFAFLTMRNSHSIIMLDGMMRYQFSLDQARTMIGSNLILGSDSSMLELDEIRLWHASLSQSYIKDNMNYGLTGTEEGLLAYYPMEEGLSDRAQAEGYTHPDLTIVGATAPTWAASAPAMVASKPAEEVAHTYTVSDDKIVINIKEKAVRIEGCTLNFMVKNLLDKHNNCSQPIRWTAYVNRNQLIWDETSLTVNKEVLSTYTVSATILNQSGKTESWQLSGIPDYIIPDMTGGTLPPLQSTVVTFTITPALAIGKYDPQIFLSGNEGMQTPLNFHITVTGDQPEWYVDPHDYEYSMNLVGMVFYSANAMDSEDIMAAFIGGRCVGLTHPTNYMNEIPYVLMDIYANLTDKQKDSINHNVPVHIPITFRYWDASTGIVYTDLDIYPNSADMSISVASIDFQPNKVMGSFDHPVLFLLGNTIEQTIHLKKGWNWVSFNVAPMNDSLAKFLSPISSYIDWIKSQDSFAQVDSLTGALHGSLMTIDAYKGYKPHSLMDADSTLRGFMLDPSLVTIPINRGWNLIGYVPQLTLSVGMALANLDPQDGDIIKTQNGFAMWYNNQWIGSLQAMTPGVAYNYYSTTTYSREFRYPNYASSLALLPSRVVDTDSLHYQPVDIHTYSGNMIMTAVVMNGSEPVADAEVGVFAGGECRAAARMTDDRYFLTIPGDEQVALQFRVWVDGREYQPDQSVNYMEDATIGTYASPYVIQIGSVTDLVEVEAESDGVRKIIRDGRLMIIRSGEVYDALGQPVENK